MALEKHVFKKVMNRDMSVLCCQIWYLGERNSLPLFSDQTIFFDPFFVYSKGKGIGVYYDFTDFNQNPDFLFNYFNKHKAKFFEVIEKYQNLCDKTKSLIDNNRIEDFERIYKLIIDAWGGLAIIMLLGKDEGKFVDREISEKSLEVRSKTESFMYSSINHLLNLAERIVPKELSKYVVSMTFEEIKEGKFLSFEELKRRDEKFILFSNKIFSKTSMAEFAEKNNISFELEKPIEDALEIRGRPASLGKVTGKVKILFEVEDIPKVKTGDIIISPMTTPDFLPAMDKAAAFVTDEGGATCHAAIVAREFGKPCIVGTEKATSILKDGDEVEVDANKGIVKILNRAKPL